MSCTTPVFDNLKRFVSLAFNTYWLSKIGAVVKVTDSHLSGWSSIPGRRCIFSHSHLIQDLITVLHVFCVKYWMPRGFPLTSSLLLNYQVQQYTRTYMYTWTYTRRYTHVLTHTYLYTRVRAWTYTRTYTRTSTSTYLQAYLHTCVHGYTCLICIKVFTCNASVTLFSL